ELLEWRVGGVAKANPEEQKQFLADVTRYLRLRKDRLGPRDVRLALLTGGALEFGAPEQSAEAYKGLGQILAGAGDKRVTDAAGLLEGAARRMGLVGQSLEVQGTTLDGDELDWKAYRGKVVLISFFAGWSGPSVQQLPALKKLHQTY